MAHDQPSNELVPREPTIEDLRDLCRELNQRGARYAVIGGFAIRAANFVRATMDIDLLVAADQDNEARIYSALSVLPDNAVGELTSGELSKYSVIRVADEIVIDLMTTAGGINITKRPAGKSSPSTLMASQFHSSRQECSGE